jgi:hypothetical protein
MKNNLITKLVLVAVMIGFPLSSIVWLQITQKQSVSDSKENREQDNFSLEEHEKIRQKSISLSNAKKLYELVSLQKEIEETWGKAQPRDPKFGKNMYVGLMYRICGDLSSQDFDNDEQYIFARKCIEQALEKRDQMSAKEELALVQFVSGFRIQKENWLDDRKQRSEYWVHAWKRLESKIDKNYVFGQTPVSRRNMNDEEKKAFQKYYEQRDLQRTKESFIKQFQDYLVGAYSLPPYDDAELEKFLNDLSDNEIKMNVLKKLDEKVKAKKSQDK